MVSPRLRPGVPLLAAALALVVTSASFAESLAARLGRNETRIYSAAFPLAPGLSVADGALAERLERLGYRRVHHRPEAPGQFFWGHERFWVFRRAHRRAGERREAELIGLGLRRSDGVVTEVFRLSAEGEMRPAGAPWLEPELLSESLAGERAPRLPVALSELPERVWRAVLAIEDARFFGHPGVDARAVARALLKNARRGKVTQGGSTITQQLVKVRDLSPRRTLGRKLSEAARALSLEAEHGKEEILEAYLNAVYLGHVGGLAVHGLGAAASAFFDKPAERLELAEAALLAGMIQGPNRLHPGRHPEAALARQRQVLARMLELGWISQAESEAAGRRLPRLRLRPPDPPAAGRFLDWVREQAEERAPGRLEQGRGVVVETTLDPALQEAAIEVVGDGLESLRRRRPDLRGRPLSAALVALDAASGDVLAYLGRDPRERADHFDRARRARRQPGSTTKPLVLLEAFERCGRRDPLFPSRRVADRPLSIELPSGRWVPTNPSGRYLGTVDLRRSLVESLNVPFVRVARWCGFAATAERFRRAGYPLTDAPPPSFVLGAIEITPLDLVAAYTTFATPGRRLAPRPVERLERPSGRRIARVAPDGRRVSGPAAAYLVRDLMREAVASGTARAAAIEGVEAWGKTGTSSRRRDAWFVGGARGLVTAVWVGLDDGSALGLEGSVAAAPLWRRFMERALPLRAAGDSAPPRGVVAHWIDEGSGLRVGARRPGARRELFRRGHLPPRRRLLRRDRPLPVLE